MKYNLYEIQEKLRKKQSKNRFLHTLGVQYLSAALAMCHHYDVEKAQLAGLLHDCAKHLSDDKILRICKETHIPVSKIQKAHPTLLHAKVGACFAKEKYGVDDLDILSAIETHTTGCPAMSKLQKIIFVADYIEPTRNYLPNIESIRKLCFEDLDQGVLATLNQILEYLKDKGEDIDQRTVDTLNYYRIALKGEKNE